MTKVPDYDDPQMFELMDDEAKIMVDFDQYVRVPDKRD